MRIGAIFALPFMPVKASEILDVLGVHPNRRNLRFALWGVDYSYGRKRSQGPLNVHIFPRSDKSQEVPGETMEELMRRRKAEKRALKEKSIQERARKAQDELDQFMGRKTIEQKV